MFRSRAGWRCRGVGPVGVAVLHRRQQARGYVASAASRESFLRNLPGSDDRIATVYCNAALVSASSQTHLMNCKIANTSGFSATSQSLTRAGPPPLGPTGGGDAVPADLVRDLTLRKLPVLFNDPSTIEKIRALQAAGSVVATVSVLGESPQYAAVVAVAPPVRAAEQAKRLTRAHFVGGPKDGEHVDLQDLPPVIGFPPRLAGRGRMLYHLKRGWHFGKSWLMYVLEGTPDRTLHLAAERLSRQGIRSN